MMATLNFTQEDWARVERDTMAWWAGELDRPLVYLASTDPVQVFIGDPTYNEAEMAVEWSGLTPGFIGLYQVNIYVPWYRMKGQQPVTLRIGGIDTPKQTPVPPVIPVE